MIVTHHEDDPPELAHMAHLGSVLESDARCIRHKESTYRGSWKKSGGRSAWFMIKRKIDRMLVMLGPRELPDFILDKIDGPNATGLYEAEGRLVREALTSEDIFNRLKDEPGDGLDGTLLAEIRDLRRYLALVEAEAISQGWVKVETVD